MTRSVRQAQCSTSGIFSDLMKVLGEYATQSTSRLPFPCPSCRLSRRSAAQLTEHKFRLHHEASPRVWTRQTDRQKGATEQMLCKCHMCVYTCVGLFREGVGGKSSIFPKHTITFLTTQMQQMCSIHGQKFPKIISLLTLLLCIEVCLSLGCNWPKS